RGAMHCDPVDTMPELGLRIRDVLRPKTAVDRLPCLAPVVGSKGTGGGDRNKHAFGVRWVDHDRVKTQTAGAWLPVWSRAVSAQSGEFVPAVPSVSGPKDSRIFDSGINRICFG